MSGIILPLLSPDEMAQIAAMRQQAETAAKNVQATKQALGGLGGGTSGLGGLGGASVFGGTATGTTIGKPAQVRAEAFRDSWQTARTLMQFDASNPMSAINSSLQVAGQFKKFATPVADAMPYAMIAFQATTMAKGSYDSTVRAQADMEHVSRMYGAGQYGTHTYNYAQKADRRGLFGSADIGGAMRTLDAAAARAGQLNRHDKRDVAAVGEAIDAARSENWSLGGIARHGVVGAYKGEKALGNLTADKFFSTLRENTDREQLRLGRELTDAESRRQNREALGAYTGNLTGPEAEAFAKALAESRDKQETESYAPKSARDKYQEAHQERRARIYAREGITFDPFKSALAGGNPEAAHEQRRAAQRKAAPAASAAPASKAAEVAAPAALAAPAPASLAAPAAQTPDDEGNEDSWNRYGSGGAKRLANVYTQYKAPAPAPAPEPEPEPQNEQDFNPYRKYRGKREFSKPEPKYVVPEKYQKQGIKSFEQGPEVGTPPPDEKQHIFVPKAVTPPEAVGNGGADKWKTRLGAGAKIAKGVKSFEMGPETKGDE